MPDKITLDDGGLEEMLKRAMESAAEKAPGWTHREASDTGVVLLELWALLADMQRYYLDQIQESHYRKYRKLLGLSEDTGAAAQVPVCFYQVKEPCLLPAGTKLLADKMVFETKEETVLTNNRLLAFYLPGEEKSPGTERSIGAERSPGTDKINQLKMVRKHALPIKDGNLLFTFVLEKPVKKGHMLTFFVLLDERKKRNPVSDEDFHMAELAWEYFDGTRYCEAKILSDKTRGLLYSGEVRLEIGGVMEKEADCGGYAVRCVKKAGEYDVLPVLYKLCLNTAEAVQQNTLCREEAVSFAPGLMQIPLTHYLGMTGDLAVYAKRGQGVWEDITQYCRITPPVSRMGESRYIGMQEVPADKQPPFGENTIKIVCSIPGFRQMYGPVDIKGISSQQIVLPWDNIKRESLRLLLRRESGGGLFDTCEKREPEDDTRPFAFHMEDEEEGIVLGDGRHGRIPAPAKDGMVLTSLICFEGEDGNAAIGKVNRLERAELFPAITCRNLLPARGGRRAKKPSEAFLGMKELWSCPHRAVSAQDYEILAKKTPGLIIKEAKAVAVSEQHIRVRIVPDFQMAGSFCQKKYEKEVRKYLEKYRLVTCKIEVTAEPAEEELAAAEPAEKETTAEAAAKNDREKGGKYED